MWDPAVLVILSVVAFTKTNGQEYQEVTIDQGVLRGFLSDDGRSYSFVGVPYATAPQRFKAPLDSPSWTGILDANNEVWCPQASFDGVYVGTEDCLVVNVYIPAGVQQNSSLPVLAVSHGGAFIFGSGAQAIGDVNKLLELDVIIVSYNYRLGALGFLCLRTEDAPGNAGLKDQVAALRWIKRNIASFGGDPDNVTLLGSSAGATSVDIIALSPVSVGLFNRVILECGSALMAPAVSYDPVGTARSAAEILGFPNVSDPNILADIFMNATAEDLASATTTVGFSLTDTTFGFNPCIERDIDSSAVLVESPIHIINSGNYYQVPIMAIYSDMEGIFRLPQWEAGWDILFEENFSDLLPPTLSFQSDQEKLEVAETIKQFYVQSTANGMLAYVDYMTDIMFAYGIIETSILHAGNSVPVYLMEFSFHDEYNPLPGATHVDFYGHVFNVRAYGPANNEVAEKAARLTVNFMNYNNPTPSASDLLPVLWPTVNTAAVNYMSFNDQLTIGQSPIAERYNFWSSIHERYYNELPNPNDDDVDFVDISLEQGIVRGFQSQDRQSFHFTGIPYAPAPLGRDRFKAPLAPPSWTGILFANNSDVRCSQKRGDADYNGTEDCLVVNVYIPSGVEPNALLPVLAVNPGGAFVSGAGTQTAAEVNRLMEQHIIVVSYNYRVGAFGFLCLGTTEAPGNAGLKDQVAALRWIKNNIASFGGNPDDVTVFGTSAGSASLELLALSHETVGLFNKIVLESGSALSSFSVAYDPVGTAKSAADFLGFPDIDDLDILTDIFINATPEELASVAGHLQNTLTDTTVGFSPCIENGRLDNYTIITDSPKNIIQTQNYNPVPIMLVYCDMEGLFRLPKWDSDGWDTIFEENFAVFLPPDLSFENDQEKEQVAEEIKQFYLGYTESSLLAYIDFMTDSMFAYSIIHSSVMHTENSVPVYLMEFSFFDEYNPLPGASHGDLSSHIFDTRPDGPVNELVAEKATAMLTNFIRTGNPVPSTSDLLPVLWPTVNTSAINYLSFNDQLTVRQSPIANRYELWSSTYERYYNELPLPGDNAEFMDISLEQGIVRGYQSQDRQSFHFTGIPYAAVPLGRDRFKAPLAPPTWPGIFNANDSNVRCPQKLGDANYHGTEHCLVANVYIPAGVQNNASLPVLAVTHGGAFIFGASTQDVVEVDKLIEQHVIIVSYNYRLGALGFLCLGTEDAPGNAGLKDQVAALRWIKNNIANFGGNPDDVTVIGTSAGSASLELLALSSETVGLFNKIVLVSASALGSFAVAYDPIGTAKSAADLMGFPDIDDLDVLTEIFINATPEELASAAGHLQSTLTDTTVGFNPCIENGRLDNYTIITDSPKNIIQTQNYNPVPIMLVYSDMEGMFRLPQWNSNGWDTIFDENFAVFLPPDLSFENDQEKEQIAEEIKQFYLGYTENSLLAYVDFMTDTLFAYSVIHSSVMHTENSVPVYLMEFSFHDEHNALPGATHVDFFGHIFNSRITGPANEQVAEIATALLTNFMRTSNPVPNTSYLLPVLWPTVNTSAINYLSFNDQLTIQQSPIAERYQFWSSIYEIYYNEFIPEPSSGNVFKSCALTALVLFITVYLVNIHN